MNPLIDCFIENNIVFSMKFIPDTFVFKKIDDLYVVVNSENIQDEFLECSKIFFEFGLIKILSKYEYKYTLEGFSAPRYFLFSEFYEQFQMAFLLNMPIDIKELIKNVS